MPQVVACERHSHAAAAITRTPRCRWLGPFILAVHDHAQCEFYRELAEFTELFVRLEGQRQDAVTRH